VVVLLKSKLHLEVLLPFLLLLEKQLTNGEELTEESTQLTGETFYLKKEKITNLPLLS
tara:strand:- start:1413 stop:1586 length:174 start_codon:yes stop_codon:yes gene_type:complete